MFDEYRSYIDQVQGELPGDLLRLARDISLHDSNLVELQLSVQERVLALRFDGCGYDGARSVELTYAGVERLTTTADPGKGLPGPHGYGDLGYDEIEWIQSGKYEHRMLFSTGIEMRVLFSDFSLRCEYY